jgi:hypothetical protein
VKLLFICGQVRLDVVRLARPHKFLQFVHPFCLSEFALRPGVPRMGVTSCLSAPSSFSLTASTFGPSVPRASSQISSVCPSFLLERICTSTWCASHGLDFLSQPGSSFSLTASTFWTWCASRALANFFSVPILFVWANLRFDLVCLAWA